MSVGASATGSVVSHICIEESLAGHGAIDKFAVDASTGQISLRDDVTPGTTLMLSYETKAYYAFTVEVEDSGSLTDDAFVVVRVRDVNEEAEFVDSCGSALFSACLSVLENSPE